MPQHTETVNARWEKEVAKTLVGLCGGGAPPCAPSVVLLLTASNNAAREISKVARASSGPCEGAWQPPLPRALRAALSLHDPDIQSAFVRPPESTKPSQDCKGGAARAAQDRLKPRRQPRSVASMLPLHAPASLAARGGHRPSTRPTTTPEMPPALPRRP
uniref:Uncharacterized protein n=1 Tax=Setaria italica TaxID=4555 RepID=K3XZP4_SETIT